MIPSKNELPSMSISDLEDSTSKDIKSIPLKSSKSTFDEFE
jgi:hypothetical protein